MNIIVNMLLLSCTGLTWAEDYITSSDMDRDTGLTMDRD